MRDFIEIPPDVLANRLHAGRRAPSLYQHNIVMIRKVFWARLKKIVALIRKNNVKWDSCLDFGGGGGVLLPSLCKMFDQVSLADLETEGARRAVEYYSLDNVEIATGDLLAGILNDRVFNVIVAADVLEHFKVAERPIEVIAGLLNINGLLITSLPRENSLYVFLRWIFGVQKPEDHYHSAKEIETKLIAHGFVRGKNSMTAWDIFLSPLFSVKCWRLAKND